ncbi:MAG: hypothetical protein ACLROY_12115 [Mediterraneibacter sp.]
MRGKKNSSGIKKRDLDFAEEQLENSKKEVYIKWREMWENQIIENAGDITLSMKDGQELFKELFETNYKYIKNKAKYNKIKNFRRKYLFIGILLAGIVLYIVFAIYNLFNGGGQVQILIENGVVFVLTGLLCIIVSKILDIKKYQETWVRHSRHQYLLEKEMIKYVCRLSPYGDRNRNEEFIKNSLKIWDGNHQKFVENMENKEKNLIEGLPTSFFSKQS